VAGVLVIVMELADKSLYGLLGDLRSRDLPGLPRDELLGYLLEAAEALDWMNFGHGLQHLDIKPHNLFLVSNHVKVADFGLVDSLKDVDKSHPSERQGAVTPLYASPELLRGTVSRHCDQYSLAIVYQQLLTGAVPFWNGNMYELMVMHLTNEPNLTPLPEQDRPIVARALAKSPENRYPSCLDFLQALVCGVGGGKFDLPRKALSVKKLVAELSPSEKPTKSVRKPTLSDVVPSGEKSAPMVEDSQVVSPDGKETMLRAASGLAGSTETPAVFPTAPTPTSASLPGYCFRELVNQSPLGDTWRIEDARGQTRRGLCLNHFVKRDVALIERLRSFTHPTLTPAEVVWSQDERLILITKEFQTTLRDRLENCQRDHLPGIPRDELLRYLRTVARALDDLHEQFGLPHLGLNPQSLALEDDSIWLTDYGLVPLVWMPTGRSGASLTGRYAAPELHEKPDLSRARPGEARQSAILGRACSASDQYSLALIYAEMITGIPPRSLRGAGSSQRRPGSHPQRQASRTDSWIGQPRVDLDLLQANDRDVLRRALQINPSERYESCIALIEALEGASAAGPWTASLYYRLPPVICYSSLQGEPPAKDFAYPSVDKLVLELAAPILASVLPPQVVRGPRNVRYLVQENDVWECKYPIQIFSGALPLKIEGFRDEWQARLVHEKGNSFLLQMDLEPPRVSTDQEIVPRVRLAFEVDVRTAPGSLKNFAEARMRVRPAGGDRDRIARWLPELAPRLFLSMRGYLQASPEQRGEDRWQCPQPLHVYPVRHDLEVDEVLDGISRNVSLGGVSFRVSQAPRAEQAYLHWHKSATLSSYAVLARIIRSQPMIGGGFEVGAIFPLQSRPKSETSIFSKADIERKLSAWD
jgi:serine/threonine protein kinase